MTQPPEGFKSMLPTWPACSKHFIISELWLFVMVPIERSFQVLDWFEWDSLRQKHKILTR